MNKVVLIGRLTRDPETRVAQGGNQTAISRYSLAVNRSYKREGEPDADFINCVAFGKRAEFVQKYLKKGTQIAISGRIQTGSYDDKDGKKVYTTDIIVDEHYFCGSGNGSAGQNNSFTPTSEAAPREFTNPTYQGQQSSMNDGFMPIEEDFEDDSLPF
jgi:single-strand DNA-binding protein